MESQFQTPFDQILEQHIKPIGLWQWRTFWILGPVIMTPFIFFPAFGMWVPPHRCVIPTLDHSARNLSFLEIVNFAIPIKQDAKDPPMIGQSYQPCLRYQITNNNISQGITIDNSSLEGCSDGYIFDTEGSFGGSLVQEYQLVCDRAYLAPLSTMFYMFGCVFSCWTTGFLSDRFGRKVIIMFTSYGMAIMGIITSLSPNIYLFIVTRFVIGFCEISCHVTSYVLLMEMTNAKYRNVFSVLIALVLGLFAYSLVPILAYLTQNWRWLHGLITFMCLPCLSFHWTIFESPRWLLAKGRTSEALTVIKRAMKMNNSNLKDSDIDAIMQDNTIFMKYSENISHSSIINSNLVNNDYTQKIDPLTSKLMSTLRIVFALVSTPKMRKRTFLSIFIWFETGMIYYGSCYYSVDLKGNQYLMFWLMGIVAVPGGFLSYTLYAKFHRRRPLMILQGLSAPLLISACLYQIFRKDDNFELPVVILATLAKILCDSSYSMIYIYQPELYPTEVRNLGLAFCSSMGRIGAATAPFVIRMGKDIWTPLPLGFFALSVCLGSFLLSCLPETKGKPLLDTIKQLESSKLAKDSLIKPIPIHVDIPIEEENST